MDDVENRARGLAQRKHGRQRRRYEDALYITHLDRVVDLLRENGFDDPALIAAAYLHDTVEDTATTIDEIDQEFGPEIAELVYKIDDSELWIVRDDAGCVIREVRQLDELCFPWGTAEPPSGHEFPDPAFALFGIGQPLTIMRAMAENEEGVRLTSLPLFRLAAAGLDWQF